MEIFKLFGSVFVETDKANDSLDKTDKKAGGLATSLGKGIKVAGQFGIAVAAGATAAAGAIFGVATKAAEATDRIDKMSQKLGLSRQGFQEWEFILSQNGASIESLSAGMKKLTNSTDELSKGGKVATESFGALGLTYEDLAGLTQEQIFEKTVVALQGVEDVTKRAALANDLLGKSGQELAPLLNAGADSVEAMKIQAQELGLVINDEAIDAGVKFTDTMDQLKRAFGAAFVSIGAEFMPLIQQLAAWIVENMPTIKEYGTAAFQAIGDFAYAAYTVFMENFFPIIKTIFDYIVANWPTFQAVFEEVFTAVMAIGGELWEVIKDLWDVFVSLWNFLSPTFPLISAAAKLAFGIFLQIVKDVLGAIKDVITWVDKALEALNKFATQKAKTGGLPGTTGSGFGINTGSLPTRRGVISADNPTGLATGGTVTSSGRVWVGENGPELLNLPKNAQVTPMDKMGGGLTFERGAFEGAMIMDDYGVDRLMDRIMNRAAKRGLAYA